MVKAPIPYNETDRLQDLYDYQLLDTPEEDDFNEIVRLASDICKVPISLITLVDAGRQWFKAKVGLDTPETPRDISFCGHAMLNGEIFVVGDARKDERFHDNPLVTGQPDIRFYAGVPLVSPRRHRLGTLCVIDRQPRKLPAESQSKLILLGKQVVKLIELRRANEQLRQLSLRENAHRQELEKVSLMQKKIISILAHDIKSPLHSLRTILQLIPDKAATPEQTAQLSEMAGGQLNSTLGLLDNLVEWGQLELRGEGSCRDCCLDEVIEQVIRETEGQAGLKGLSVISKVQTGAIVCTDENRLRFILRNLLTNAIKFTKEGGITIDAVYTAQSVRISVQDTGIGMPASILEQLFHGGKKISRKGTRNEAGSGLGLTLVREFAGKMKGTLKAESEVGKGTLIMLELPLRS